MSLFARRVPLTDEEYKDAVAAALLPVNDDYAWEIAEAGPKAKMGYNELWLLRITGEATVRVQGYTINSASLKSIKSTSWILLKDNPQAKMDKKNSVSRNILGFYANIPNTVQELETQK